MNYSDFGFSFPMQGIDRQALLAEAADRLDALENYLGEANTTLVGTPGRLARDLMEEHVEFAGFPVVYKITNKDFLTRHLNVPITFKQLSQAFDFYWLYFPIALFPKHDWGFHRLEVAVIFNPDESVQHLRPKAYQILPAKEFQTLLEVRGCIEVCLDESFKFKFRVEPIETNIGVLAGGGKGAIDVKAASELGTVIGPFVYRMKRAKIDHTPVGMEMVRWRLEGAEFFQEDDFPLIVIVQVPKETRTVNIAAAMQAYHHFVLTIANFQRSVKYLPEALRNYFTGGMPVCRQTFWDDITHTQPREGEKP